MGLQKVRSWIYYLLGGVLFLSGCLLLNCALSPSSSAFQKFLLILATLVALGMAALIVWLRFLSEDREPNYFLYDPKIRKNRPVEELTFAHVNERMSAFLSRQSASEAQFWSDFYLETQCRFGRGGIFRPLVAYKLLYDLADEDSEAGWRLFLNARNETVSFLCASLAKSGDTEMAKVLQYLKVTYPRDAQKVRNYLVGNRSYLQSRMVKFVAHYIDWFY